ncbi:alpha/beta fold hydrolase [Microbacterium sp. zg.B48]|uniref:alpha/beta hydrolase family protein n=1 Tax=Microbacterium sp. zg.B48 TaxID=2969408 RepID=UPI00214CE1CE|nr:alpha/beta fold hydrolase [Microbacterium sp. zg.B48]MCR2763302.1 alpha/beta fold hydrolase [Microbacterium sp. zg.B48]
MAVISQHPRRPRRHLLLAGLASMTVLIGGCASAPAPPSTPAPSATAEAPVIDTSTLRTIIDSPREQPALVVGELVDETDGVTSHAVTYDSAGLTISGILRTPAGEGPFPAVVVVHGSVDPELYQSGSDLEAEQRALIESGYVVLATDLRGYAESDPADPASLSFDHGFGWPTVLDWGMALDVVNALAVLRSGQLDQVDPERIGLLGHSLGGLLAVDAAVIAPGSSDLVVALSAATTSFGDVIEQYAERDSEILEEVTESVGMPSENPEYWADVAARTFFDRATEPLLLIHGEDDDVAPAQWSEDTAAAWREAGGEAEVVILEGADHALKPRRDESVQLTIAAFDAVIGSR